MLAIIAVVAILILVFWALSEAWKAAAAATPEG
jgi:hypothetical protein